MATKATNAKPAAAKKPATKGKVKMTGIAAPKKEKKVVISLDEQKHVGTEPKWDTDRAKTFDTATFDRYLRTSFAFYNYFFTQKGMKKFVVTWVQANMQLTKQQLAIYIMSDSYITPMTVCSLVKAEMAGMPMREKDKQYIVASVLKAIAITEKEPAVVEKVEKKVAGTAPTIQDRLAEKTSEIIGEIEGQVDNAFKNRPISNIYEFISEKNLAQAQVGKVRAHFQKQIDELSEFVGGADEQLNESFKFLTKADLKRIGAFYVKLMADLESYTNVKKATKKVKIKRPQSKDKLVAKVKYMKESKELKLVSVPLVDVIGAQAVWCYQTKYRKLGKYVADAHSALGIKGTSITGFSEALSVQKTLRKPEEQLKEFMKAGKVQLRTFLKDIKSVETKLNGRLSADILVLKVE